MEVQFDPSGQKSSISPAASRRQSYTSSADVFEGFTRDLQGLQEWTSWRTKLNSVMVDIIEERHRIFSYPNSRHHIKQHTRILKTLTEPRFSIGRGVSEFALSRAVHDYVHGEDGFHLDAESFLSFGIPRVKLQSNRSFDLDGNVALAFSPASNRATEGSIDVDKVKDLETASQDIMYSESSKQIKPSLNEFSNIIDLDSSTTSAVFIPTADCTDSGVYL